MQDDSFRPHVPFRLSIRDYAAYRRDGFVTIPQLVPLEDVDILVRHTEDLMQGRLPQQNGDTPPDQRLDAPPANLSPAEKGQFFTRIHMLHRKLALHEQCLLHPRVLDVVECLVGPDVLALQTMLFLKPPGANGQGWHQDTYYIPTHPDTLIGAWIALDEVDEYNGGMWMAIGSQVEPVYPPEQDGAYGDRHLPEIHSVKNVSATDDSINELSPIADRYPQVLCPAKPGDVVFFNSHVLHRSKQNITTNRWRRAFVSHYCNARSFTQWGAGWSQTDPHSAPDYDPVTRMSNCSHILARGDTHLPFAQPKFGTLCAATLPPEERKRTKAAQAAMGNAASGNMEMMPAEPDVKH